MPAELPRCSAAAFYAQRGHSFVALCFAGNLAHLLALLSLPATLCRASLWHGGHVNVQWRLWGPERPAWEYPSTGEGVEVCISGEWPFRYGREGGNRGCHDR